jgi:ABC-2 type transport system ATP-binding protein
METMIAAQRLCKQFSTQKGHAAVENLDLAIARGQLYGLVGPDGAGKTTTLRMLATVLEPSSGAAQVAGCDIRRESEKVRRRVGYMPQNFSLYPDLSVIENLNFFADINQMPASQKARRIAEMLAFTRLEPFQSRWAGNLSGGMKKKLALACALVHEPEVLLLDEPSTGVDPVSRRELWMILAHVVQNGVTVLVSTPYMDEAERCHQVGMLYQGRLLTSGSPEELERLLSFSIIEVKAKPRKAMRSIVEGTNNILEWRPVGDRLRLAVSNAPGQVQEVMAALDTRFRDDALEVKIMRQARPTMEDVFVNLVDQQRKSP